MAITLIRKNSDTPNVRNYDDTRLFRYATYGKTGIIKDYMEEVAMSAVGYTTLHIGTGEIVHQGWQVEINSGGVDIALENYDDYEYYSIYLEINLSIPSQQKAEIKYLKGNVAYPVIDPGDDLTRIPSGTSRTLLAHIYLQKNTSINVDRIINVLPYMGEVSKGSPTLPVYLDSNGNLQPIISYQGTSHIAEYASDDTSKGTIEERLTAMGFNEGVLTYNTNIGTMSSNGENSLKKMGKFAICTFRLGLNLQSLSASTDYYINFTIPQGFRPKQATVVKFLYVFNEGSSTKEMCALDLQFDTNGTGSISFRTGASSSNKFYSDYLTSSSQVPNHSTSRILGLYNVAWEIA